MIEQVKQYWDKIPPWLRNKYVITIVSFALILFFFNKDNVFALATRKKTLNSLERQINQYEDELIQLREQQQAFKNDQEALEKFAREEYRMKKDDEDVFVIVDGEKEE